MHLHAHLCGDFGFGFQPSVLPLRHPSYQMCWLPPRMLKASTDQSTKTWFKKLLLWRPQKTRTAPACWNGDTWYGSNKQVGRKEDSVTSSMCGSAGRRHSAQGLPLCSEKDTSQGQGEPPFVSCAHDGRPQRSSRMSEAVLRSTTALLLEFFLPAWSSWGEGLGRNFGEGMLVYCRHVETSRKGNSQLIDRANKPGCCTCVFARSVSGKGSAPAEQPIAAV